LQTLASSFKVKLAKRTKRRKARARRTKGTGILFKRSNEAIRGRLASIFNALADEQQKRAVQECLDRDDLQEMKILTRPLQGHSGKRHLRKS
jgi:hypothetical protein